VLNLYKKLDAAMGSFSEALKKTKIETHNKTAMAIKIIFAIVPVNPIACQVLKKI
jgi:hypothetical protein